MKKQVRSDFSDKDLKALRECYLLMNNIKMHACELRKLAGASKKALSEESEIDAIADTVRYVLSSVFYQASSKYTTLFLQYYQDQVKKHNLAIPMDRFQFTITVEDLKNVIRCSGYLNFGLFRVRVIEPLLQDINQLIDYELSFVISQKNNKKVMELTFKHTPKNDCEIRTPLKAGA